MSLTLEFTLSVRPSRSDTLAHWTVFYRRRDGLARPGTKHDCGEGACAQREGFVAPRAARYAVAP